MTTAPHPGDSSDGGVVPAAVADICQVQDQFCDRIRNSIRTINSELAGPTDREDRLELAAGIADVSDELRGLYQKKLDVGFFGGPDELSPHLKERVAHLQSDYRRSLNELKSAQQETATGKPRKACRQLTSWLSHYDDLMGREADLFSDLWQAGNDSD